MEYNKLDDAVIDEDEKRYNSQFKGTTPGGLSKGGISANNVDNKDKPVPKEEGVIKPKTRSCNIF